MSNGGAGIDSGGRWQLGEEKREEKKEKREREKGELRNRARLFTGLRSGLRGVPGMLSASAVGVRAPRKAVNFGRGSGCSLSVGLLAVPGQVRGSSFEISPTPVRVVPWQYGDSTVLPKSDTRA